MYKHIDRFMHILGNSLDIAMLQEASESEENMPEATVKRFLVEFVTLNGIPSQ